MKSVVKKKKIFYLNGPMSSGKDSLTRYITSVNSTFGVERNSDPLKKAVKALFSISDERFNEIESNPDLKNVPMPEFYGRSIRELYIDMSEKFAKIEYSKDFFGESIIKRIHENTKDRILIPDSGFAVEALPVIKEFGAENIFLIKLIPVWKDGENAPRSGKFLNDSRSYLSGAELGVEEFTLENRNLDAFYMAGSRLIYPIAYGTRA